VLNDGLIGKGSTGPWAYDANGKRAKSKPNTKPIEIIFLLHQFTIILLGPP
jgi:hypothetical protein